jgi:hypothetical protein
MQPSENLTRAPKRLDKDGGMMMFNDTQVSKKPGGSREPRSTQRNSERTAMNQGQNANAPATGALTFSRPYGLRAEHLEWIIDNDMPIGDDGAAVWADAIQREAGEPAATGHSLPKGLLQRDGVDRVAAFSLQHQALHGADGFRCACSPRTSSMGTLFHQAAKDGTRRDNGVAADSRGTKKSIVRGTDLPSALPPSEATGSRKSAPKVVSKRRPRQDAEHGDECQKIQALMPDYLLQELSEALRVSVVEHIRKCSKCHSVMMSLRVKIKVAEEETREKGDRN